MCINPTCSKKILSERFPGLVLPYRRATARLETLWTRLGLFLGGEGGARLAHDVHVPTSADTILHLVHRIDMTPTQDLRVIGIDEWAWRKGRRYGVILADHIAGLPIDLLAECTREAVIEYLKGHPNLEVITRDRSDLFSEAAQQAVPKAVQVADQSTYRRMNAQHLAPGLDDHKNFNPIYPTWNVVGWKVVVMPPNSTES